LKEYKLYKVWYEELRIKFANFEEDTLKNGGIKGDEIAKLTALYEIRVCKARADFRAQIEVACQERDEAQI